MADKRKLLMLAARKTEKITDYKELNEKYFLDNVNFSI